jgi:hypothetical protein
MPTSSAVTSWRRLLPLVGLLLLAGFAAGDTPPAVAPAKVQVGMTARQVRELLGPPARVARQIYSQTILEQWLYDRPEPLRLDLRHRLGQEPLVESVRPPARR